MNDIQILVNIAGTTAELIESGKLVSVVQCKDCRFYHEGFCFWVMRRHGLKEDWFCKDGKPKDAET